MRVLLITYEFPPIESAQSLRWLYLSRHLIEYGVDLTVLTPKVVKTPVRDITSGANVVRSYPGPFVGISSWISDKSHRGNSSTNGSPGPMYENWAEKTYRMLRGALDKIIFPDVRSEWYPFAKRSLSRLKQANYDLIIASHEPGVDLMLGMSASRQMKVPLVIDLADPLVTPYSPRWRKLLDSRLERKACRNAAGIITTAKSFSRDLMERYGLKADVLVEIEQGFDWMRPAATGPTVEMDLPVDQFWLLFTGNFYQDFRNPMVLLESLQQRPGMKLLYAGHTPSWLLDMFRPLGQQVRCLGRLSHQDAIAIQRRAPVLLNLGNAQAHQVPGKLYEYFGAGRPILHVALNPADSSGELLQNRRRGIAVNGEVKKIIAALDKMQDSWSRGILDQEWDLSFGAVAEYSWEMLAKRLLDFLESRVS